MHQIFKNTNFKTQIIMKKIYLVQVLMHEKEELQNYSYYESYSQAINIAEFLKKDKLLNLDYVRIKEIIITQ